MARWKTILITLTLFNYCSQKVDLTPDTFMRYERINILQANEAKIFVDRLHFQAVARDSNRVAFYRGDRGDAIIYLTYYPTGEEVKVDYQKMTQKISPQNSVFVEGKYIKVKNKEIYRCFGMGQTHFVFYEQSVLFWLSLPTLDAHDFITAYLDYITN